MRLLTILFFLLYFSSSAGAQLGREIGLRSTGLNNGSFLYRVEKPNGKWRRMHFGIANLEFSSTRGDGAVGVDLGLSIGWENRERLADRLQFLHGWEPFASVAFVTAGGGSAIAIAGGVGYIIGVQYELSEHVYIGLETTPRLQAMINDVGGGTRVQVEAGFDSRSVALTAVYRFVKE